MKILPLLLLVSLPTLAATAVAATVIPFERDVSRVHDFAFSSSSNTTSSYFMDVFVGDEQDRRYFQGYRPQNEGPNDIVTSTPEDFEYAYRNFSLVSTDRARRDNYLWVTDYNGSGSLSDLYETMLVFLPRENQMHIEETPQQLVVTLNTGEEVFFSKKHRTISGGVLSELPIDLNPDQELRKFPQIKYHGKGVVIRSDARAADPRLTKYVQVLRNGEEPCKVPAKVFWTQEGFPKFRFITDEEAYRAIEENCGKK